MDRSQTKLGRKPDIPSTYNKHINQINRVCSIVAAFAVLGSSAVLGQSTGNHALTVDTTTKPSLRAHGMAVSIVVKTKVVNAREFLGARFIEG